MRPTRENEAAILDWLKSHPGWERSAPDGLRKSYAFKDFSEALAFVVRVGLAAERFDHHPDLELGWGRAYVRWSTHDAKGITSLDFRLAELCDTIVEGHQAQR